MFNLSTQDVVLSIENAPLVNINGKYYQEYRDFFGKGLLDQLKNLGKLNLVPLEKQENSSRSRVDEKEGIIKKLRILFMHRPITKTLEKKFNTDLKFESVDIWLDNIGYYMGPHIDDSRIKLAVQIYLGDDNIGTSLFDDDNNALKTFQYESNTGYALLNTKDSRHGPAGEVTKGTRKSVYVRYR